MQEAERAESMEQSAESRGQREKSEERGGWNEKADNRSIAGFLLKNSLTHSILSHQYHFSSIYEPSRR